MSGIERGEHKVAIINLMKIASALNMTLAQLVQKAKL